MPRDTTWNCPAPQATGIVPHECVRGCSRRCVCCERLLCKWQRVGHGCSSHCNRRTGIARFFATRSVQLRAVITESLQVRRKAPHNTKVVSVPSGLYPPQDSTSRRQDSVIKQVVRRSCVSEPNRGIPDFNNCLVLRDLFVIYECCGRLSLQVFRGQPELAVVTNASASAIGQRFTSPRVVYQVSTASASGFKFTEPHRRHGPRRGTGSLSLLIGPGESD